MSSFIKCVPYFLLCMCALARSERNIFKLSAMRKHLIAALGWGDENSVVRTYADCFACGAVNGSQQFVGNAKFYTKFDVVCCVRACFMFIYQSLPKAILIPEFIEKKKKKTIVTA